MAFTKPYITDKFTAYPGDVRITTLSLAVWVMDDFTKNKPAGNIKVMIKDGERKAFQNLSWYYLFTDLPAGNYTVAVEADLYFSEEVMVAVPCPDPKNPVIEITLKPRPAYPFPNNATLVKGLLSNAGPVTNAAVKVIGKTIETITDERGEFILYFKGIKKEDIAIEIKKNGNTKSVNATIEECKTVSLGIIIFP
jgi:hypothetical protein